jgi:hypothetical protein
MFGNLHFRNKIIVEVSPKLKSHLDTQAITITNLHADFIDMLEERFMSNPTMRLLPNPVMQTYIDVIEYVKQTDWLVLPGCHDDPDTIFVGHWSHRISLVPEGAVEFITSWFEREWDCGFTIPSQYQTYVPNSKEARAGVDLTGRYLKNNRIVLEFITKFKSVLSGSGKIALMIERSMVNCIDMSWVYGSFQYRESHPCFSPDLMQANYSMEELAEMQKYWNEHVDFSSLTGEETKMAADYYRCLSCTLVVLQIRRLREDVVTGKYPKSDFES